MLKRQSVVSKFQSLATDKLSKITNPKSREPFLASRFVRYALFPLLIALYTVLLPAADAAQVALTWDPSSSSATGYRVHYGRASRNYDNSVDVGNSTSCTISGLQEGETYYFSATAYNAVAESNFSQELVHSIPVSAVSSISSPVSVASLPLEFGEVQVDSNWKRISFSRSFADPVVVANPLSLNGPDPAVIRIRNVGGSGFEICIQEWNYLDGTHTTETVSYLVMERGSFTLGNGARVEAGRFSTDKIDTFGQVSFKQSFAKVPVVITSIASFNGPDTVTGRVKNVGTRGFDYTMQEQESLSNGHAGESVAYIAWEPSSGTVDGIAYEIGKTGSDVSHSFHTVQFKTDFTAPPLFFADMQTANGTDPASVRWQNKDEYAIEVRIDEEQSEDDERDHAGEAIGYMVIETASPSSQVSSVSLPLEFGEAQINSNWKRISFSRSFTDPVVVANPLSLNGPDPAVIRIRNVGGSGFEIRVQEWNYLDGTHAVETVSYLVMERGSFTLGNGARVEAGRFSTDKVNTFGRVSFKQSFAKVPVVVTSIASFNGSDTVTGRVKNVGTRGFDYTMQEQESLSNGHAGESVAYIAWEPSTGTVDGIAYEIGKTGSDVSHGFHTVQFKTDFTAPPLFFADMQTANGADPANVRWQNKDAYAIEVQIDEEQSQDDETGHAAEVIGFMAISR